MKSFKRLLIALDFTPSDEALLRYASAWCQRFGVEHVCFLNVQRNLALPKKFKQDAFNFKEPLDEKLRRRMAEEINNFFPNFKQYHYEFDVIEGNPRDKISHWTKVKGVDLIMVGVKEEKHGRGILPQQLLRNVKCSVLFVPEKKTFALNSICVPVKLGSQGDMHFKYAVDIVGDEGQVIASHFYSIPASYHMVGTSGMLLDSIKEESEVELDKLIRDNTRSDKKYDVIKVLDSFVDHTLTNAIEKNCKKFNCDLTIMQAGRKSMIETFLIGSETEAMVKKNRDYTLLILKD